MDVVTMVDNGHQGFGHARWVGMLNDIAPVHDSGNALLDQRMRTLQYFEVRSPAAAAHQYGNATGDTDHLVIIVRIGSGVGFDDVSAQFNRLTDQGQYFLYVAIHHIAARFFVWLENKGFNHQRHAVTIAIRFDFEDVPNALVRHFRLVGNLKEIDHDAG